MKFQITQDKNQITWALVTNAGVPIAPSATVFKTVEEAQFSVKNFQKWIMQAYVEVIIHEPNIPPVPPIESKDWKQQAIEQLKKKHHAT